MQFRCLSSFVPRRGFRHSRSIEVRHCGVRADHLQECPGCLPCPSGMPPSAHGDQGQGHPAAPPAQGQPGPGRILTVDLATGQAAVAASSRSLALQLLSRFMPDETCFPACPGTKPNGVRSGISLRCRRVFRRPVPGDEEIRRPAGRAGRTVQVRPPGYPPRTDGAGEFHRRCPASGQRLHREIVRVILLRFRRIQRLDDLVEALAMGRAGGLAFHRPGQICRRLPVGILDGRIGASL